MKKENEIDYLIKNGDLARACGPNPFENLAHMLPDSDLLDSNGELIPAPRTSGKVIAVRILAVMISISIVVGVIWGICHLIVK